MSREHFQIKQQHALGNIPIQQLEKVLLLIMKGFLECADARTGRHLEPE